MEMMILVFFMMANYNEIYSFTKVTTRIVRRPPPNAENQPSDPEAGPLAARQLDKQEDRAFFEDMYEMTPANPHDLGDIFMDEKPAAPQKGMDRVDIKRKEPQEDPEDF